MMIKTILTLLATVGFLAVVMIIILESGLPYWQKLAVIVLGGFLLITFGHASPHVGNFSYKHNNIKE